MKLNRKLILPNLKVTAEEKFLNCTPQSLRRGDYVKIFFFAYDDKKKGGFTARLNKITAIVLKKKIKYNIITLIVSVMYKNEKVKWS